MMSEPKGESLRLPVYTRRWDNHDYYRVWVTATGWYISHIVHNGECDPSGEPYLYNNFRQDYVDRPWGIGSALQKLWYETRTGKSPEEIQRGLNAIGAMIEESERSPRTKPGKRRP